MAQFGVEVRVTGENVSRHFGEIAGAAEKAQERMARANRRGEIGLRAVNAGMADLRTEATRALGSLGPVGSALQSFSAAGPIGLAVAGLGAVATGLVVASKRAADFADELDDQAQRVGIGVEALQEYRFAAGQVGVPTETLQKSLQILVRNIGQAQAGTGSLVKALKDTDAAFLEEVQSAGSTERALDLVIKKIAGTESVFEQARLAQAAFGRGAGDLIPLLAKGAGGIDEMRQKARQLGIVISEDLVRGGSSASDAIDALSTAIKSNLTAAFLGLAPTLESASESLARFVAGVGQAVDKFFGLSFQGQIDALVEELENARETLRVGGPDTGPGGGVAALEAQLEQLRRDQGLLIDARRAEEKKQDAQRRAVSALAGVEEAGEAARQEFPEPGDELRKLEEARREAQQKINEAARLTTDPKALGEFLDKALEIDRRYAAAKKKIQDQSAKDAEAALKKESTAAEKAAEDQKRAADIIADAKRRAALAGLEGEPKFREQATQDIERESERIRELVKDEKQAADLITAYRVEREKEAQAEIDEFKADELEKAKKQADDLWKHEQELDAKRIKEADDAAEKARKVELDAAKDAAEAAAKAREAALKPLENTLENIQRDLGDALVDAFTKGGDAAKSFEDVVLDMLQSIGGEIAQLAISKAVVEPLLGQVEGLLGGVLGGAGTSGATTLPEGVAGPLQPASEAASSQLLKVAGAAASTAAALIGAGIAIAEGTKQVRDASFGQRGPGNALAITAGVGTAVGVGSGAAIGAAVGTAVPGIGNIVGAAVGAAVGGALSTAITSSLADSLSEGIRDGVADGLNQAGLNKAVARRVGSDPLLNIISGGLNMVLAPLLSPLFTPDIEQIFAKMFRQVLGGTGGLNTAGIDTSGRGRNLGIESEVGRAARLIAEAIGAGGAAFGAERAANFEGILAGGVGRRAQRTGEDAGVVLAETFVGAFQGSFLEAAKAALRTGKAARPMNLKFIAQQFAIGAPNFGFDYAQLAAIIDREENVPQGRARKQSREAFGKALEAAFADAADSSAFRKSLAGSVQSAFAQQGAAALTKALGETVASFFSVSRERRQDLRRARRRGDAGEVISILTDEFQEGVKDLAAFLAQPAFVEGIRTLTDEFLRLQVATALAAGDSREAADAIEQRLAPQIQLVKDALQLSRDVRSRTALALAGPGFAGDRAQVDELRRARVEEEARFTARTGGLAALEAARVRALQETSPLAGRRETGALAGDPRRLLDDLRAFADARLSELEAEIALQRQIADAMRQAERAFRDLGEQADVALGRATENDVFARQVADAQAAFAAASASGFEDPALVSDLQAALGAAIGTAIGRIDAFDQLKESFDELGRSIATALGTQDSASRIRDLFAALRQGVEQTPEALSKALNQVTEAAGLATQRRDTFRAAADEFGAFEDTAMVARRGRRGERDLLARRRAEIQRLLGLARGGGAVGEEAIGDLRRLLPETLSLGQSALTRGRFRSLAAELERAGSELEGISQTQVTIAERQLRELEAIAKALGGSAEDAAEDTRGQLDLLRAIAADAEGKTGSASAAAIAKLEELKTELTNFKTTIQPIIDYVTGKAADSLSGEFERLAALLGTDGDIVFVLREVRDRLPAGRGASTAVLTAGTTQPAVQIGQVVVHFQEPPRSHAEAREYARTFASTLEEQINRIQQRTNLNLKRVA